MKVLPVMRGVFTIQVDSVSERMCDCVKLVMIRTPATRAKIPQSVYGGLDFVNTKGSVTPFS